MLWLVGPVVVLLMPSIRMMEQESTRNWGDVGGGGDACDAARVGATTAINTVC